MKRITFACIDTHGELVYVEAESQEIIVRELPGYRILGRAPFYIKPTYQQHDFSIVHLLKDVRVWKEVIVDDLPW